MPTCPQCGAAMDESAKFCGFCGAKPSQAPPASTGSTDETVTLTAQAPPPAPPPPPSAPQAEPSPAPAGGHGKPAAPAPKKSGGKGCIIVVLVLVVVGFLVLALGGVGGYLYLKKKGASWRDLLHKGQVNTQMQQEQQPAEGESQPQEEPQPSYEEQAQPQAQPEEQAPAEEAQPQQQPPAEEAAPPVTRPAPAKPKPSPRPVGGSETAPPPVQETQPPPAVEQQPAPREEASAPKVKKASFGLIFESSAYVTKLVVKVDGEKQFEQALSPTGSKMRVEKTFLVPEGAHHIRVAMWRAQGQPIAQEWDFTFQHGQNPAFKVELSDNWQPTLKRLQ